MGWYFEIPLKMLENQKVTVKKTARKLCKNGKIYGKRVFGKFQFQFFFFLPFLIQ